MLQDFAILALLMKFLLMEDVSAKTVSKEMDLFVSSSVPMTNISLMAVVHFVSSILSMMQVGKHVSVLMVIS